MISTGGRIRRIGVDKSAAEIGLGSVALPDNWFQLPVRPLLDDRLNGFQADFSLLLGAGFADPDHAAALGAGRLFIEDKFDHLAAPKIETSAQSETFFRGIEDEAGEPLGLSVQIDDQAGAPLRHHTLRAAGLEDRKFGHSFNLWSTNSDGTPGLVSFEMRNDEPLASCGLPRFKLRISRYQTSCLVGLHMSE